MALVVPFALDENRHLIGIRKEYHTRKRKDQHVVYITVDRDRKYLLASQRLAKTADYINENCIIDSSKANRVSFAGLWDLVDERGKANNGWHKGRWFTTAIQLHKAKDYFERERENYEKVVVIGDPRYYETHGG